MTTFLLIRHGLTDGVGHYLSGTVPGTPINEVGRTQVDALVERLHGVPISRVIASPLERAQQTARPIAQAQGLALEVDPAFIEFEVGDWTGRTFSEMATDPAWRRFNTARSLTRPPRGELMLDVQHRAVTRMLQLSAEHPSGSVVIVSHGDVIRAALMYFLGMPIDLFPRVEILPAAINVLTCDGETPVVWQVNGGIVPPIF